MSNQPWYAFWKSSDCKLDLDQLMLITKFSKDLHNYINDGREITRLLQKQSIDLSFDLDYCLNNSEDKLHKLDKFLNQQNESHNGAVGGALLGATVGASIGGIFCWIDAGAMAALLGLIGGAIGQMMVAPGIKLGPLLSDLIDNISQIQKIMTVNIAKEQETNTKELIINQQAN